MSNQEHASSLPQINVVDSRNSTERNTCEIHEVEYPVLCDGREFGLECRRVATHFYPAYNRKIYPLCEDCWLYVMRIWKYMHDIRKVTRGIEEEDHKTGGAA